MTKQKAIILAVSGGVDSVVLLDSLARKNPASTSTPTELVVAHFNHGIRPDANEDESLVKNLAEKYGLAFEVGRAKLGAGAGEEVAREARFKFLRKVAKKYSGIIATAHHKEDVVESVAVNLIRGTGWRGLVPLDSPDTIQPLLYLTKSEIYEYAAELGLTWREDSTNDDISYLRNRVRQKSQNHPEIIDKVFALYEKQSLLKKQIDELTDAILKNYNKSGKYSREFFGRVPEPLALELLRAALKHAGKSATRPQLNRLSQAIKTYQPGKKLNLLKNYFVNFDKNYFYL